MSSIKEHLAAILEETAELSNEHTTEADEFIAIDEIEKAVNNFEILVHEARKVFERTKRINDEKSSSIQKAETDST